jgi:hypothetical protein
MDFETRKKYYNLCDPDEPLEPDDARNVDLDALQGARVRGDNWVERLAGKIELSSRPVFELFTGLPGSGKSTELRRLAARLREPEDGRIFPVLIGAEDVLDLANEIDIPDILAAILHQTEVAVLKAEGRDPEKALQDGYLTRLWSWLTRTDVSLGKEVEFAIPAGPKLVVEMKTRPKLRQRVRETVSANLTTFLAEARQEMSLLRDRVLQLGYRDAIVIFDSLEKLRGISTNWEKVLTSAERVFAAGAPYLRMPVHVLFTTPPALVNRCKGIEFLPVIKLHERGGRSYRPGIDAARLLIHRRIPDEILSKLLGPNVESRVDELIGWSAGYPREIVRMIQSVILVRENPVPEPELQFILAEVWDDYRKLVPADAFEWLARVAVTNYLTIENDGHRSAADLMLQNSAVLRYLNGGDWYDLHPAVRRIPGVEEAIRDLKKKLEAAEALGG